MSDNKKYTAEDIRLYLEGKLSPAEMHAMERASLDDPFLADAIEGMQHFGNNEQFVVESAQLKESLNERVKKKRRSVVLAFPMIAKIAAVLTVVVTGVAIIIFTGQKNQTERVEIVKKEEKQSAPRQRDTGSYNLYKDSVVAAFKQEKPANTFKKQEARQIPEPPPLQEAIEAETYSDAAAPIQDSIIKNEKSAAQIAPALEGRVAGVDMSNTDSDLQEVVVMGYGVSKKQKKYNSPLAKSKIERRIEPEGGWQQFENYLGQNKNTDAYDTTLTGTQKLSFTIDSAGRPALIAIIHSISPGHDKELIRLINNGPDWAVKRGNKRKVVLSVVF